MTFYGYKRPDGRVGVRNHILILPASVCASDTTRIVASQVTGAVTFNNQNGCSQVGSDQQLTMDVMAGYAANPNVYGTVVISLGCENCQMDLVVKAIQERTNKPLKQVIIQEAGGTLKAIEQAIRDSDLGVNPSNDGSIIRVVLPELTEERRREFIKIARGKGEDAKVSIRAVRRKAKDAIDKLVKDGEVGEDDGRRAEKELDDTTAKYVAMVDELLKHKEAELLEV